MRTIPSSELIINGDGSIFHLHLKPEQLADVVILVGALISTAARSAAAAATAPAAAKSFVFFIFIPRSGCPGCASDPERPGCPPEPSHGRCRTPLPGPGPGPPRCIRSAKAGRAFRRSRSGRSGPSAAALPPPLGSPASHQPPDAA